MQINIQKAYQYYIDNRAKSCHNVILTEEQFHQAFAMWLQELEIMSIMHPQMENIPVYNDKCKTSRIINIHVVIKKCI